MLVIIDNQSSFIKEFKQNFLIEQSFDYVFFDHNQPIILPEKTNVKGIILSGGKGNPYEPLNLTTNFVALMNYNIPIIGFCLGHEIIAVAYQSRIRRLPKYQYKKEKVRIIKPEDPIFQGIDKPSIKLQEKHNFHVSELSDAFEVLGSSEICPYEIIKHKSRPIYGFQSHPEVSGKDGLKIIHNFLKICNISTSNEALQKK